MIEFREAAPGELKGTAAFGQHQFVVVEDGELTGCICFSRIQGEMWVHDYEYWGSSKEAAGVLLRRCFRKLRELRVERFYANVKVEALNVMEMVRRGGGKARQVIFEVENKWRG